MIKVGNDGPEINDRVSADCSPRCLFDVFDPAILRDLVAPGQRRKLWGISLVIVLCAQLAACEDASKRNRAEEDRKERDLLADTQQGLPELWRRLRDRVRVDGRVLVLKEKWIEGAKVLPLPATWRLNCGFLGLEIVFVTGPREDDYVQVGLTDAELNAHQCNVYAPRLGNGVRSILERQQNLPTE